MTTQYAITRDNNSYPSTGSFTCMIPTDTAYQVILTANTVQTIVVPSIPNGSRVMAKFSYAIATGNPVVWARPNGVTVFALPTTSATATSDVLNPVAWELKEGATIQLLTAQTGVNVSISYYALSNNTQ
jgi:hypothetical protein